MSVPNAWRRAYSQLARPNKKMLNRMSWGLTAFFVAVWVVEAEQKDPRVFSEAPRLFGTPQAAGFQPEDMERWNAGIAPKDSQLQWRPPKVAGPE
mmetsp:Transcript_47432/g.133890  ORF Transcript_47432/g.133890 Transcript_47432/m.133890 type:complete len:95 (+) Transcript_47432:67-351(+)